MTDLYSEEYETYLDTLQEIIDLQRADQIPEAVTLISDNLAAHADKPELYLLTAVCSYRKNDLGQAIELCEQAHKIDPDCQEVVDSLAVLKTVTGNVNEGLYYAKLATVLDPHPDIPDLLPAEFSSFFHALSVASPSRHYLDGLYKFNSQLYDEAATEFERELKLNPENLEAVKMLGHSNLYNGDPVSAFDQLSTYHQRNPEDADTVALLGKAACFQAKFDDAADHCRRAVEMPTATVETHMLALESTIYFDGDLRAVHDDIVGRLHKLAIEAGELCAPDGAPSPRDPDAPINVGMLSNDLRAGQQQVFALPFVERLDKKLVDLTVYQQSPTGGPVFQEFKSKAPNWRRVVDVDDDVLALIISRQKTDVLIDLCGFSSNARSVVCAAKAAPAVINMFCQPYGFGAPGSNVIIGDAATMATDQSNLGDEQKFVQIEHGLFAFTPPHLLGDVQPLPALDAGHVTFGATCRPQALTPSTIAFWSGVLRAVSGSRLLLGNVANIPTALRGSISSLFGDLSDRVGFMESASYQDADPAFFAAIDIYLDSLPVNGSVDLCHALWLGVPVVTVMGDRRSGVIGASILTSAGRTDDISRSIEDGVAVATRLSSDLDALSSLRQGLRDDIKVSPLMDVDGYAAAMQDALRRALDAVAA